MFDDIATIPQITNHGAKTNQEIRDFLPTQDIFAYPSIWPETSCLALIEAMTAGLICVHSSLGALFETGSNWTMMYDFDENPNMHAGSFYKMLEGTIDSLLTNENLFRDKQMLQKQYSDAFYNWNVRKMQWAHLLNGLKDQDTAIPEMAPQGEVFSYNV